VLASCTIVSLLFPVTFPSWDSLKQSFIFGKQMLGKKWSWSMTKAWLACTWCSLFWSFCCTVVLTSLMQEFNRWSKFEACVLHQSLSMLWKFVLLLSANYCNCFQTNLEAWVWYPKMLTSRRITKSESSTEFERWKVCSPLCPKMHIHLLSAQSICEHISMLKVHPSFYSATLKIGNLCRRCISVRADFLIE
jgi:hypothetical protein